MRRRDLTVSSTVRLLLPTYSIPSFRFNMKIEVDMNTLVTMFLLLAPLRPVHAALILDTDNCCSPDNRSEGIDANTLNNRGSRLYVAGDYAQAEAVLPGVGYRRCTARQD